MRRWLPYLLIAASVTLGIYAFFFRSSDEDLIRARLAQLTAAVSVDEGEQNPVVRHGRLRKELGEVFTKDVLVRIPEATGSLRTRDDLIAAATQLGAVYTSADVDLKNLDLQIDAPRNGARVTATAVLTGARHGDAARRDERKVALELDKIEGEWKVVAITVWPPDEDDEGAE